MLSIRTSAAERTRRRVRGSLWVASALALALPGWFAVANALFNDGAASIVALVPVAAYFAWRLTTELVDENDIGVSPLDRVWLQVERHLPDAVVRRLAWRTLAIVGVVTVIASAIFVNSVLLKKDEAPQEAPAIAVVPLPESEVVPEQRAIPAAFPAKVEVFPRLAWPAYGSMATYYGTNNVNGIEIYIADQAAVTVSATGTVAYAGPDLCCGFGYTVVVEHEDGWVTTYGRLTELKVRQGDHLKRGETVGLGGASQGQAPRVQFQVQRNGRSYDPLTVLPASQMGVPASPPSNQVCSSDPITLDANSVVNLALTASALQRYEIESAQVVPASPEAAGIDASVVGVLSMVLQVPPTGEARYLLHVGLRKPDDRVAFDCPLVVRNAADVPLSVVPASKRGTLVLPTPAPAPAGQMVLPTPAAPPPASDGGSSQPSLGGGTRQRPTSTPPAAMPR